MLAKRVYVYAVLMAACLCLSNVRADMFGFMPISHNAGATADAVAAQLSLEVTQSGPNVLFTFRNNLAPGFVVPSPLQSSITGAWFDDRADILSSLMGISNGTGVSLSPGGNPDNLPSGNNLTPPFGHPTGQGNKRVADFWATADSPTASKGVNAGEQFGLSFSYVAPADLATVLAALNAGAGNPTADTDTLRIGIHVQQLIPPTGGPVTSDAFVLTPPPAVPVPAAVLLGVLGLTTAGCRLRRFA